MARYHPSECRVCGARAPYVHISARGKCPDHSALAMGKNLAALKFKSGPLYDRWLAGRAREIVRDTRQRATKRADAA